MALPKEPRQKMINIMYLVLMAMLALNVSSEILNAFRTVNNSLDNSNAVIDDKNKTIFTSLAEKLHDPKTAQKAEIWAPKAEQARSLSENIFNYINVLEERIRKFAGYDPAKGEESFDMGQLDAATNIMVDHKEGDKLLAELKTYKAKLLAIDPLIAQQFSKTLPLDLTMPKVQDKSNNTWSLAYFHMTPAIAAVTILKKFQNDIKNSEAQVVEFCHNQIGQIQLVYDQFNAIATASSQYVFPGQPLSIYAGVGAFSAQAKPIIRVNGAAVPLGPDGMAEFKSVAGAPGAYTAHVDISFTKPDGSIANVKKDIPYTVAAPSGLTVSADKVRVLYIGVENPITIAGGDLSKTPPSVSMSQGQAINRGNGHFDLVVNRPGNATVNVEVNGKVYPTEFRVLPIPDPVAMVGVNKGGAMSVNEFKAQAGVRAVLENFLFEGLKYNVTSYTITFNGAGYPEFEAQQVNGNTFGPVRSLINQARPGSTIMIDEIRVSGPGGSRSLPPISFNLQ